MRSVRRKSLPVIGMCLLSWSLAGCAASGGWAWWKKADPETEALLAHSPTKRLEDLREMARQAPHMEPTERERVSAELAQTMQSELDPELRAQTVRTLAAFATPAADGVLLQALKDGDGEVRMAACEAWGSRQGPDCIRVLSETLGSDTDIDVRLAAAKALGQTRDPAAVQGLGLALDDPNPALQYRAVRSLKNVSGRDFGNNIDEWRQFAQGRDPQPKQESLAQRLGRFF